MIRKMRKKSPRQLRCSLGITLYPRQRVKSKAEGRKEKDYQRGYTEKEERKKRRSQCQIRYSLGIPHAEIDAPFKVEE